MCLHCRWEARTAARERRRRLLLKGSSALAVLSTLGVIGLVGRLAIHGHGFSPGMRVAAAPTTVGGSDDASTTAAASVPQQVASPPNATAAGAAPSNPAPQNDAPSNAAAASTGSQALVQQVGFPHPAPAANVSSAPRTTSTKVAVAAPVVPIVPQGQSAFADSLMVTRTDSVVTVWFDRKLVRTRIPEKFERFVRSTLPALYGPIVDSALAKIPEGALARQGDLINELPTRGMHIPVAPGWALTLFPIVRPGHDGPLVTQYRVLVIRG